MPHDRSVQLQCKVALRNRLSSQSYPRQGRTSQRRSLLLCPLLKQPLSWHLQQNTSPSWHQHMTWIVFWLLRMLQEPHRNKWQNCIICNGCSSSSSCTCRCSINTASSRSAMQSQPPRQPCSPTVPGPRDTQQPRLVTPPLRHWRLQLCLQQCPKAVPDHLRRPHHVRPRIIPPPRRPRAAFRSRIRKRLLLPLYGRRLTTPFFSSSRRTPWTRAPKPEC